MRWKLTGTAVATLTLATTLGGGILLDRLAMGEEIAAAKTEAARATAKAEANDQKIADLSGQIEGLRATVEKQRAEQIEFYRWMYEKAGEKDRAEALESPPPQPKE